MLRPHGRIRRYCHIPREGAGTDRRPVWTTLAPQIDAATMARSTGEAIALSPLSLLTHEAVRSCFTGGLDCVEQINANRSAIAASVAPRCWSRLDAHQSSVLATRKPPLL